MIPNILSIAGSDPSGGAGIQADLKAISANGGYGMAALTGLTAQNTRGVSGIHMVPPAFVTAQIEAVFDDIRVDAVKIGMLGDAAVIAAVAQVLEICTCPIVLDPVMVAKSGDRLLAAKAVEALREVLIPRAAVITPNLPEAADLLDRAEAQDRAQMEEQAAALLTLGPDMVLLKGGHLGGNDSPDLLMSANRALWLESPRYATRNSHGTGCSLSSALATRLVLSDDAEQAVESAKSYVSKAISGADRLSVGQGHGPLDHFWMLRNN